MIEEGRYTCEVGIGGISSSISEGLVGGGDGRRRGRYCLSHLPSFQHSIIVGGSKGLWRIEIKVAKGIKYGHVPLRHNDQHRLKG